MNDDAQSRMIRRHRDRRLSLGIPVVISFLMALAVASLIFYFSSRPADASNSDSGRMIVFIARIFGYDVGSMPEAERILFLHKYNYAVRKAAHFSEFAALGFLVMHFLDLSADASSLYVGFGFLRRLTGAGDRQTYFRVIFSPRPVVIAVCFSVLYALSDEIHQIFIDGRAFGLADILIDSAGAVVGIAVCILFRTAAVGARKKKEKQTGTGGYDPASLRYCSVMKGRAEFMSLKFTAAMIAAKLARSALRLLGRDGSCTPGRIALKICPDFMAGLKLPEKVLCVTGTNGKTTTSNLAAGMLRSMGYSVTNNSAGSNIQAGVATALLADSTLSGRAKKQIAVLEVDERSSLLVYKYITPDILLCNNLMRDSLKRNAHTDFISYILNTALPSSTRVILNADDFICSSLFPDNTDRTYFGVSAEIPERSATPRDIVYCPDCGGRLTADYLRYDHIGRIRCPNCGKASPEPDFCVTSVDREGGSFTITSGGSERSYRLLNGNLVNIYNFCGAVALLTEAGFDPDRITEAFDGQKIVASRFNSTRSGRLNITLQLAKGQNPGACSRSYSYVAARPEKNKCLLIMTDDKNDNHKNSESVCWIFDTDFSALKDPSISQIIFAGKRCRDQRLRALMAGIDRSKILICDDLFEGAALIDTEKYTDIFILNDPYILAEAGKIRDYLVKKGKESGTK